MYAVNVTIKVQNELAKKAIILALKDWSNDLFQNNGLMLRCFVDRTENQVEIFHVFRTKKEMEEVRTTKSNKFWDQIKETGGQVTRFEGGCELEVSRGLQDLDLKFKYSILIGDDFNRLLEKNFSNTLKRKKIYVIYDEFLDKLKLNVFRQLYIKIYN